MKLKNKNIFFITISLILCNLIFITKVIAENNVKPNVFSSSSLPQQGNNIYSAEMAFDGDKNTTWSEGVNGNGFGEWLAIKVPDSSYNLTAILIRNGYHKNSKIFKKNNRIKIVRIYQIFDSSVNFDEIIAKHKNDKKKRTISDDNGKVLYSFKNVKLKNIMKKQKMRIKGSSPLYIIFEIRSVYKGSKYDDTCISEVEFQFADDVKTAESDAPVG